MPFIDESELDPPTPAASTGGGSFITEDMLDPPETWREYIGGVFGSLGAGSTFGGADEAAAGLRSILPGFQDYDSELAAIRQGQERFAKEHPVVDFAGQVAGSAAFPAGAYRSGSTVMQRLGLMSLEGAGYGALYGYGTGEGGAYNRLKNSGISAAVGGVTAPVIGTLLGRRSLLSPDEQAAARLAPAADDIQNLPPVFRAAGDADPLYQYQTLAEATQNPRIAQLEQEIGKAADGTLNERLVQNQRGRRDAQLRLLNEISTAPTKDVEIAGIETRRMLEEIAQKENEAAASIYTSINPGGKIPVSGVKGAFDDSVGTLYEAGGAPSSLRSIQDEIRTASKGDAPTESLLLNAKGEPFSVTQTVNATKPFSYMNSLRQRAQEAEQAASAVGDKRAAATAGALVKRIDEAIEGAGKSGGMNPADVQKFNDAKKAFSEYAGKYREGQVGYALRRQGTNYQIGDSSVVSTLFNGKAETTKQLLRALPKNADDVEGVRGAVRDKILRDTADRDGNLSPASFGNFLLKNREGLEAEEAGRRLFEPEHIQTLQKIAEDLRFLDPSSEKSVRSLAHAASRGQSTTVSQALLSSAQGLLEFVPGMRTAGKFAEWMGQKKAQKVNDVLARALTDKDFAKALISKATPQSTESVLQKLAVTANQVLDTATRSGAPLFEPVGKTVFPKRAGEDAPSPQAPEPTPGQQPLEGDARTPQPTARIESQGSQSRKPHFAGSMLPLGMITPFPLDSRQTKQKTMPKLPKPELEKVVSSVVPEKDRAIMMALIKQESGGNTTAVSKAGAKGLTQLMPAMAKAFGVSDVFDPVQNLQGGYALFQEERDRFKDLRLALAAYNAGSPRVRKAIEKADSRDFDEVQAHLPKETRDYVKRIMSALA